MSSRDRQRSRSPSRDDNHRDSKNRDYGHRDRGRSDNFGRGSRGGRGGKSSHRGGYDARAGEWQFVSNLPDLPEFPTIPPNSKVIPYADPRPRGSAGLEMQVLTNHFSVRTLPLFTIFCYDFRFRVPLESQVRGDEKVSIAQLARAYMQVSGMLNDPALCFDGVSMAFSPKFLIPFGEESMTILDMGKRPDGKSNNVEFFIKNRGPLDIRVLVDLLINPAKIPLNPMGSPAELCLKWIQTLVAQKPHTTMVTKPHGTSYFDRESLPRQSLKATAGILEVLRGIHQSQMMRFNRLTINVDICTSVFYTPQQSFTDLICGLIGDRDSNNLTREFKSNPTRFFQACSRLLGMYFQVRHLKNDLKNSRRIKFTSWSKHDSLNTLFKEVIAGVETPTSVNAYYLRKYNITLKHPRLPLCSSPSGAQFPLELCYSATAERYKGILCGDATSDLLKFATVPAFVRQGQVKECVEHLSWHTQEVLAAHGISIETKFRQISGRILPAPSLAYDSSKKVPQNGRWNLQGLRLVDPAIIHSWVLIYLPLGRPPCDKQVVDRFCLEMSRAWTNLGIRNPGSPPVLMPNPLSVSAIINEGKLRARKCYGKEVDLMIFILGSDSPERYQALKGRCDTDEGISSQFLLEDRSLRRSSGQLQYLCNLALKANVKLGGTNHHLQESLFTQRKFMMIGGDCSLPPPSAMKRGDTPAIVALVASFDDSCTKYSAVVSIQPGSNPNCISNAKEMFEVLLKRYVDKHNGRLPDSIIYWRDGTSESELSRIRDEEGQVLKQILQATCDVTGQKVALTLILAIKRHHTRLFIPDSERQHASKLGNVPAGTVVENSSTINDVFIVSQTDLQGTKRPTRYLTIFDENKLSANDFQRLSNGLCSSYARATTSVSVVPPIYYAHQVCKRASEAHMADQPNGSRVLKPVHPHLALTMWWQ